MKKNIYVLGVGHNTPIIIELAEDCGYRVKGLFHYDKSRTGEVVNGYKILGSFDELYAMSRIANMNFALSQGDNKIRTEVYNKIKALGGNIPSLIHPTAKISKFSTIGGGTYIGCNSIITANTKVQSNVFIGENVVIQHNCAINENSFIAFCSLIGAYTTIEEFVFIGAGANLISGKVNNVGKNAVIGAGSVLTSPVCKNTKVCGVPAKLMNNNGGGYNSIVNNNFKSLSLVMEVT